MNNSKKYYEIRELFHQEKGKKNPLEANQSIRQIYTKLMSLKRFMV